jgi:GNAT superfamily N-acetyltransferase
MLTYQVENWAQVRLELWTILPSHYQELALDQDKVPLSPIYEIYKAKNDADELLLVTIRDAGKLVGYFLGFVAPSLHYSTCLTCTMDIFYVIPEVRGQNAGWHLFKKVEEVCRQRGVKRMFVGSKMHKDASFLFEKLGYREIERYYSAWLGD